MFDFLKPDYYFRSVFEIPDLFWKNNNVLGILFDIDNTLEPYAVEIPSEKTSQLFKKLSSLGIQIAIISNNKKERVEKFASPLNVDFYYESLKPKTENVNLAISKMNISEDAVLIIGDQLFTDIWCGRRANIRTVFVDKLSDNESFFIRLKRFIEIPFVKKIKKRGYSNEELC